MKIINTLTLVTCLFLIQGCFNSKYELEFADDEERGIKDTVTGKLVVAPAVVGFENENGHYFGYRLPKRDVRCKESRNGRSETFIVAQLDLKPVFFSLNLETGLYDEFTDRSRFDAHLESLDIKLGEKYIDIEKSSFVMHYRRIYEIYDFSSCNPIN